MANNALQVLQLKYKRAMATLPRALGNEAVNYSLDAFKNQSWDGQQWRRRFYRKKQGPSIGVKSGRMRRGTRIVETAPLRVVIGNDVPYAKAHNDGFTGNVTVKAHTRAKYSTSKVGSGKFTVKGIERMKTVKSQSGETKVKSHQRKMNLPRRRFIGKTATLVVRLAVAGKIHIIKSFNNG